MARQHHLSRAPAAIFRLLTATLLITSLIACSKQAAPVTGTATKETGKAVQTTFASPEEAGAVLLAAAQSADPAALLAIFGPEGKAVVLSGDPVKDKDTLQEFVAALHTRWGELTAWFAREEVMGVLVGSGLGIAALVFAGIIAALLYGLHRGEHKGHMGIKA